MNLFVCGGGTGGHFFSGVAVAEKFLNLNPEARVIFVGTRYGIEGRTSLPDPRMKIDFVWARGVKGRGLFAKIQALFMMAVGFVQSLFLLFRHRPQIVIGVGGYASAPTVFAALIFRPLMRWRVMVLEQNSFAGLANRLLARMGARGLSAFPCEGFERVELPLRQHYIDRARNLRKAEWPIKSLLLLGGSQGAGGLNQEWVKILSDLKNFNPAIHIFHQTGTKDFEAMKKVYADLKISAEVFAFSEEMPSYFDRADLLICRSGAMTVFETVLFQRPAIFVPFPKATDDHQRKNALSVQDADWVIDERDFSWPRLRPLLQSPQPKIPAPKSPATFDWETLLRLPTC